jgi:apolipoprotein N-acyltransferase
MLRHSVSLLLWMLVGVAKTIALVLLISAADTHWRDALAWLALAFGLVTVALVWRTRTLG